MSTLITTAPEADEASAQNEFAQRSLGSYAQRVVTALTRPDLRNGALSLVNQAVVNGTNFLTCVIIGRLSKEELGIFSLALTIVYFARGIQEMVICAPYVIYSPARQGDAQSRYSGSSLLHHLVLSAVSVVVLVAILVTLALGIGPPQLAPAIWVLLGALPFMQLREFIRRMSIAHLRLITATVIDVSVAVVQLGGMLLLARLGMLSVTWAYGVMGIACAVAAVAWFLAKTQPLHLEWSEAVADWWHNWKFARWSLASHLVGFTTPTILPWVVTIDRGSESAGVFAACVSVVGIASTFMIGLGMYITPRAAMAYNEGGVTNLRRVLRNSACVFAVVLGGFATFVLGTGDFMLVVLYGAKYIGYGHVLGVLALGMMTMSFGMVIGIGLWAIDRPKANLIADVCSLVVTLVLVFWLIDSMGVMGVAIGDLSGKIVGCVVRYLTLQRLLHFLARNAEA